MAADVLATGLLQGLSDEDINDVMLLAQRRSIEAGSVIFTAGEPACAVHVVISGIVQLVQRTPNGSRMIVKYVRPGEVFGSPALLGRFYPTDAIAVTDCVEFQWSSEIVRWLVDRHPPVALNVIRDLEARLREMESRLRDLSSEPVEQRLARATLQLIDTYGQHTEEGVEIPFPITRQDLADLIGSTLHVVSRTLSAWETQGRIKRYRRRLVIADVEAVARVLYGTGCPEEELRLVAS